MIRPGGGLMRGRAIALSVPAPLVRLGIRRLGRRVLDPGLPWDVQRQRLASLMAGSPVPRATRIAQTRMNGVSAEVITAGGVRSERTVVHFHGGGYCVGSARMARTWAARLSAAAGCRVVLPRYRLAPEHPYPAALDDAREAMKALLGGTDPASVVISGDSAGGGLALALAAAMRDEGAELPAGCLLLSPWLDLGQDRGADPGLVRRDLLLSPRWLHACASAYTSPSNWADPAVSPLFAVHAGLPPLLIQAGTDELLAPDSGLLAASASAAGVDVTYTRWPRMWHDFALQPGMLAAASSALSQSAWFVRKVTGAADR